jgi:aryl-alcohol dehydrogenase-like predicted oxidoreductase
VKADNVDATRRQLTRSLAAAGVALQLWPLLPAMAEHARFLTRAIPKSGEALPAIGLGTWQEFDIRGNTAERGEAIDTLRTFVDAGLRVIDTSPMYGAAESLVGELLEQVDARHEVFVATKVWTNGAAAGRRQIEDSFRLLRRERIDLIQVHNLLDVDAHLSTLQQMKKDDRVRYIGITHYAQSAHAELVRHIERGAVDFVQVNYSLAEPEAETSVLPAAAKHRVAVLVNRPLAQGAVLAHVRGKALPPLAAELGITSWAQFALKWIVSHPAVTCAIPGTRNPKHLLDNVAAATGAMPDAAMRARMAEAFRTA